MTSNPIGAAVRAAPLSSALLGPAHAELLVETYYGFVGGGTDARDLFGLADPSLADLPYTALGDRTPG
jgi:hypothetical protein